MSDKFDSKALKDAEAQFLKPCTFMLSVAKLEQLPDADLDEIAFAGRSNVGKSSLINALFNQKKLAKTSSTPGRTQQLNFFNFEIMKMLDISAVSYQIILTKNDKISAKELEKVIEQTAQEITKHAAALPDIVSTSSEKKIGLDLLKAEICSLF